MFDINKTDGMTSRKRKTQLADEDEGKETNPKKKSPKNTTRKSVLESSSLLREKKNCPLKTVDYNAFRN